MEKDQILEFNLISAQGLKQPSANLRRLKTYAVAWIDPSIKLRTRIDHDGEGNPTWNDKFLFRVSPNFISCETSAVDIHIYAVGYIKNVLLGTVRFLLSNCLGGKTIDFRGTPAFTAVQIRRSSGKFRGVLNVAVAIHDESEFPLLKGLSAVNFRKLTGENEKQKENNRRLSRGGSKRSEQSSGGDSCDFDFSSIDLSSDGAESTTSSSSPAATCTALREWNGLMTKCGAPVKLSDGVGMLCGLMTQNKIRRCPSDLDQRFWEESLGRVD